MEFLKPYIEIDVVSALIALWALGATFATVLVQYRHNRLIVRPLGKVYFDAFQDRISVFIKNDGFGPLIFKNIRFYDIVKKVNKDTLIEFMPTPPDNINWSYYNRYFKNKSLLPGNKTTLIELKYNQDDHNFDEFEKFRDKVIDKFKVLEVSFSYESLYRDKDKIQEEKRDLAEFSAFF